MLELGYINKTAYDTAVKTPLNAFYHDFQTPLKAQYAAELVRQQLEQMYGDSIYTDGFNVYTTLDSHLQTVANESVINGLLTYDQRHGYRGPEKNLGEPALTNIMAWKKKLRSMPMTGGLEPAAVLDVDLKSVTALRNNGSLITIPWNGISWARKQVDEEELGPTPSEADDVLRPGDVIRIMPNKSSWRLAQIPKAESGMVALNPQNGQILAMVGGFDYQFSNFNRITNALRQPGSSFKPFIYSAALEKGYTLASVINDAPIVIENPTDHSLWRPQNDTGEFYGPTRLREALAHSRNLVSIRLLSQIGTGYAVSYAQRFGFSASQLPATLSLALGTASVTPLDMASAYAVFANSGYKITPFIIDTIRNTQGHIIYQAKPLVACASCLEPPLPTIDPKAPTTEPPKPESKPQDPTHAPRVISAQNAFLITSALHDVVVYGTGAEARNLKRNDLAGKTGTTNDQYDAWFVGYNSDLVALSWVGFDQPQSLLEYGAQAALPIWIDFMRIALKGKPEHSQLEPPNITHVLVDKYSGERTNGHNRNALNEVFMEPYTPGNSKTEHTPVNDAQSTEPKRTEGSTGIY
jgi:penicillin-binding protein 1A